MNQADADRLLEMLNGPKATPQTSAVQTSLAPLNDQLPPERTDENYQSRQSPPPAQQGVQEIYATWGPVYRRLGYHPVPITLSTKACHMRGWQEPVDDDDFKKTLSQYRNFGIGLVMGSVLPDGTRLAALDVDKDDYMPLAMALLRQPTCVRVGARGVGIFVRLRGDIGNVEFRTKSSDVRGGIKHSELLAERKLIVIPPTIHPDTDRPYRWTGPALHEISFNELPIIEV